MIKRIERHTKFRGGSKDVQKNAPGKIASGK